MIDDSWPWKRELYKAARDFRLRKTQKRWTAASWAKIEMLCLGGAFAIRRLVESAKISDEVESTAVAAESFAPKARRSDFMNRTKIEELYDLSNPTAVRVSIQRFCNQFIHSFILTPVFDPDVGLSGWFVASDHARVRACLFFNVDTIVDLFERIATDDVVSMEMRRDHTSGELKVIKKSNRLLSHDLAELRALKICAEFPEPR